MSSIASSKSDEDKNFRSLSRHVSSPHLDGFVRRSTTSAGSDSSTNKSTMTTLTRDNRGTLPHLSTFSSFATKSRPELRVQDDPNPYSISQIQEFKIQIRDPFNQSKSSFGSPASSERNSTAHYYQELDDYEVDEGVDIPCKLSNLPTLYKNRPTRNSAGYEVPECEGSSGSSEDLPIPPSDISDEYSNSLSIVSSSDGMSPVPSHYNEESLPPATPSKISPGDRARIELSFSGRKTKIYVSESLANLYVKSKSNLISPSPRPNSAASNSTDSSVEEWVLKYTGVPVLLLDIGETKSRDKRRIQILLAELGSGLALWKDTIDNLSSYTIVEASSESGSTFHTMRLSSDHTKVIGLSFDNVESAGKFGVKVDDLTSDFANISLSGAKSKKDSKGKKEKKKKKIIKWHRPSKTDISSPCAFQHVSSLCSKDPSLHSSLQHFVAKGNTTIIPNSST